MWYTRGRICITMLALALAHCGSTRPASRSDDTDVRRSGPWGQLHQLAINLYPPEDMTRQLAETSCGTRPQPWVFVSHDRGTLDALFAASGLSQVQRTELMGHASCKREPAPECIVEPPLEVLMRMDPASRSVLYRELSKTPRNMAYFGAFHRRPAEVSRWLDEAGVSPDLKNKLRGLMYPRDHFLFFADFELMCATLKSVADKASMMRALSQAQSLMVKLTVPEQSAIDSLVLYYGTGGRLDDVKPLLASLSQRPGGGTIDIMELLPPFARSRLNTYPNGASDRKSCFWSALNFFSEVPDDGLEDPRQVSALLRTRYHPVSRSEARLGDVILYVHESGATLHAAVYVADDIAFSKNGVSPLRPYSLTTLAQLRDEYHGTSEVLLRHD